MIIIRQTKNMIGPTLVYASICLDLCNRLSQHISPAHFSIKKNRLYTRDVLLILKNTASLFFSLVFSSYTIELPQTYACFIF